MLYGPGGSYRAHGSAQNPSFPAAMHRVPDRRLCRTAEPLPLSDGPLIHEPVPQGASIPEALVHDLWETQRFDRAGLTTTDGVPVQILDPGVLNTDAGPDFSNAHVRIDGMDWHGDVEIHLTSGAWFGHSHDEDERYNRVILHVTLHADLHTGRVSRPDGSLIPEVVLEHRLHGPLRSMLRSFHTRTSDDLVCAPQWRNVPDGIRHAWIQALGTLRVQRRARHLQYQIETGTPAAQMLHERLFEGLGYAKNSTPMIDLARRLPAAYLRTIDDTMDRVALHLGTAGLLPEPKELLTADRETADAVMDYRARFARLHARREIPIMNGTAWTFFRLRPNNVPTLRIAQGAAWFDEGGLLTSDPVNRLRDAAACDDAIPRLRNLLAATPGTFWRSHYRLTRRAKDHDPSLGRSRIDTLIVDAVVPFLIACARYESDDVAYDHARRLMTALPAKRDSVTRRFRDLGTRARTALDAQGMHQLYKQYCTKGGCLQCRIGRWILEDRS